MLETIVGDALRPGSVLPPESDLGRQFGVSRLTVREGMKALSTLGVVTIERGRGTSVNPETHWSRFDPAVLAALVRSPADDVEASRQLVEARRLVEVGVAALAAERREEPHLGALDDAMAAMWSAHETADCDAWAAADLAFHDALMDAAGNAFITVLFVPLGELLRIDRHGPADVSENRRRALTWHQRILDAVQAGDVVGARAAMDGHLRDTEEILTAWRSSSRASAAEVGSRS
ncbi:MAG: FCD domain-containing protein [Actinomycetota bacterium]